MSALTQSGDGNSLLNEDTVVSPTHLSQQRAVIEISSQALLGSNLDQLIQQTLELLRSNLRMEYGEISRYYPQSKTFQPLASIGWKVDYFAQPPRELEHDSFARFICEQEEVVVISDFAKDQRFKLPYFLEANNLSSGMAVVIRGKEEFFGILGIYSEKPRTFNTIEINFVKKISILLALIVDRQRIESSLNTSRSELDAVLNGIQEGISIQAQDGQVVYANNIALSLLGFTDREDLLNTPLTKLRKQYSVFDENGDPLPPENLPAYQVFNGAPIAKIVLRFQLIATGEDRWFIVTSSPVRNAFSDQIFAVNIFQDITIIKESEIDQRILSEASEMFSRPSNHDEVLQSIADNLVKNICDWCVIYMVGDKGKLDKFNFAHRDPNQAELISQMLALYPPDPKFTRGAYKVIRSGDLELYPLVTDGDLRMVAQSEEHFQLLKKAGMNSIMIVPIKARGNTLGAISLIWSTPGCGYADREINLVTNLAHRAGLAIDNARLYAEAQKLNEDLEAKVLRRTAQLERTNRRLQRQIAEREIIERDLQRNKALFSDLFELSPDAIFLVNNTGEIVRVNAQAGAVFGYTQSELVTMTIEDLLPNDKSFYHVALREVYQQNPRQLSMAPGSDLYGRKKDGKNIPVDVLLSPVKIENEWLIICVVRDITTQKQAQAELAEVQHRLLDSLEAERLMLAQELHDGTIQELFSINYQLADVANDVEQYGSVELSQKIQDASAMTQSVIEGLRTISREMRPPALAPFGLEQAIYSHMERFQELHPGIQVNLDLHADGQNLEERVRLVLFRIYQNAVSNVARHAEATQVWVRFGLDEQCATLEIRDDGKGFSMPARWVELARRGHLGLVGTRERVEAIGGELTIQSEPGEGTSIRVRVPKSLAGG